MPTNRHTLLFPRSFSAQNQQCLKQGGDLRRMEFLFQQILPFLSVHQTKGAWCLSSSIISKLTCIHPPSYILPSMKTWPLSYPLMKQKECDVCPQVSSQNRHACIHLLPLTLSPSTKTWQNQHQNWESMHALTGSSSVGASGTTDGPLGA